MRAAFTWIWRREWLGWLITLPMLWVLYGWATDRTPPLMVANAVATPARAGEETLVTGSAIRDLGRGCSAQRSRAFLDSRGVRHDYGTAAIVSNAALREEARIMGDSEVRSSVVLPEAAAPGVGMMILSIDYRCNPLHYIVPINYTLMVPVEVLP